MARFITVGRQTFNVERVERIETRSVHSDIAPWQLCVWLDGRKGALVLAHGTHDEVEVEREKLVARFEEPAVGFTLQEIESTLSDFGQLEVEPETSYESGHRVACQGLIRVFRLMAARKADGE
jgi:hypothetical protein